MGWNLFPTTQDMDAGCYRCGFYNCICETTPNFNSLPDPRFVDYGDYPDPEEEAVRKFERENPLVQAHVLDYHRIEWESTELPF